jgi:hypothetical protein
MPTNLLSDAQLARMRADVLRTLPGTAVIQAVTTSPDGAGGFIETWAAVAGGAVPCRVDPINLHSQIERAGGAEAVTIEYTITLPDDAPAAPGNRLVTGGQTYEIRRITDEHSWRIVKRCDTARIR